MQNDWKLILFKAYCKFVFEIRSHWTCTKLLVYSLNKSINTIIPIQIIVLKDGFNKKYLVKFVRVNIADYYLIWYIIPKMRLFRIKTKKYQFSYLRVLQNYVYM